MEIGSHRKANRQGAGLILHIRSQENTFWMCGVAVKVFENGQYFKPAHFGTGSLTDFWAFGKSLDVYINEENNHTLQYKVDL